MLNHRSVWMVVFTATIVLSLIHHFGQLSLWALFIPLLIGVVLTTIGSFHIRWQYHLPVLYRNAAEKHHRFAITFDDGPHVEVTPHVLDVLAQHKAKATFFLIGKNAEAHPELVQRIVAEGHTIGNHGYAHDNGYGFKGKDAIQQDVEQASRVIHSITGRTMRLFRPPFGVTNPSIAGAVKHQGMTCIGWGIRSLDTTSRSDEQVWQRIQGKLGVGEVVLLHDTIPRTVPLLERLLGFSRTRGMKAVTVDELFDIKAYT